MWLWLAACDTDGVIFGTVDSGTFDGRVDSSGRSGSLEAIVKVSTPDPDAPLVRRLDVIASAPASLTVTWDDRRVEIPERSETHSVLLVGLRAGSETKVSAVLEADLFVRAVEQVRVRMPAAPDHFPVAVVGARPWDGVGDTLLPLRVPEGDPPAPRDLAAIYDDDGQLVYWLDVGDTLMDVRATDDGLVALVGTSDDARLVRYRWDGVELGSWAVAPGSAATLVDTPWRGSLHHDGGFLPDGSGRLLALARTPIEVPDYPASYDDPSLTRARAVADDVVLLFGADGAVEREVHLSSFLPTSRVGYGSLDTTPEGWGDWAHANAVEWQPDGSTLLSLRHQDLVVKLDPAGAPAWLLGHDVNLTPELQALRLQPVGEVFFPWHQHGTHLGPERKDGTRLLTLFDNGNDRAAPFTGVPRETEPSRLSSRVVGYSVDEAERTVREEWSFQHPSGPMYSEAVGDADQLPNGEVLAVWGYVERRPDGRLNTDVGDGRRSVWVVQIAPPPPDTGAGGAELVWELVLTSNGADNRWGWAGARVQRVRLPGGPEPR